METIEQPLTCALVMTPEIQREIVAGTKALAIADAYKDIDCAEIAQEAANERKNIAKRIDGLKAAMAGFVAPAKQIVAHAESLFKPPLATLELTRDQIGQHLLAWDQKEKARIAEETRVREEAARKARQEADAKAAAELARAEEQAAELRRKQAAAEAQAKAAAEEGNARAAAAAAAQAATLAKKAEAAIENSNEKAAQAQIEAVAAAPEATVEAAKIEGSSVRDNWVAELAPKTTDEAAKLAVLQAVLAGRKDLLALILIDEKTLNKLAKAYKKAMDVPGYVAVNRPILAGARK